MALPTSTEVRAYLEGYQITSSILSDDWIDNEITNSVVPYVEKRIRGPLSSTEQVTEWYSGNGTSILFLNRRNIVSLDQVALVRGSDFLSYIALDAIDVEAAKGVLKARTRVAEGYYFSIFPKGEDNLKITYTVGNLLDDSLTQAVLLLACEATLAFLADRTGGGSINTQGWSRDFGPMGKYTHIRRRLARQAHNILREYGTGVVGA